MQRLEVYFCTVPGTRPDTAEFTLQWWQRQPCIDLKVITPDLLGCTPREFQRLRRKYAEENSGGQFYVLTDDDCLPDRGRDGVYAVGYGGPAAGGALRDTLTVGLEALASHDSFAILSAWPANCTIQRWTPEARSWCEWLGDPCCETRCSRCKGRGWFRYHPQEDWQVMEHVSVGGLRICRKGAMKHWPEMDGPGYDMIHAETLRQGGWRVGYARDAIMTHLGERMSTVWV